MQHERFYYPKPLQQSCRLLPKSKANRIRPISGDNTFFQKHLSEMHKDTHFNRSYNHFVGVHFKGMSFQRNTTFEISQSRVTTTEITQTPYGVLILPNFSHFVTTPKCTHRAASRAAEANLWEIVFFFLIKAAFITMQNCSSSLVL